jgi:hypothetical protein
MGDRKIISINPELLSFSNFSSGKTQKKREPIQKELKIRTSSEPRKGSTKTLRNKLLQYIRKTQEDNYKRLHGGEEPEIISNRNTSVVKPPPYVGTNTFEESIAFMNNIQDQVKHSVAPPVKTLKNYHSISSPNELYNTIPDNVIDYTSKIGFNNEINNMHVAPSIRMKPPNQPQWGCLRGGSLPTFRSWKTQKQRNEQAMNIVEPPIEKTIMQKTREKLTAEQNKPLLRYKKQKKTIRRTYRVGKSKYAPKVSVLVSNKTIRNSISEKTHAIQQIPIEEIRRGLLKQGFIKVGTSAPNDVLRKMYESVSLICGEVQNHNPDNLLYNFLNDTI